MAIRNNKLTDVNISRNKNKHKIEFILKTASAGVVAVKELAH